MDNTLGVPHQEGDVGKIIKKGQTLMEGAAKRSHQITLKMGMYIAVVGVKQTTASCIADIQQKHQ